MNNKFNNEEYLKNTNDEAKVKNIKERIQQRPTFDKIITNNDEIFYECKKCGYQCANSISMGVHTRTCFSKKEKEQLYKEFLENKGHYIKVIIDGITKYKCKGCGKIFDSSRSCGNHGVWCCGITGCTEEEMEYKKKNRAEKSSNTREILYGDPGYHNIEQMKETNLRLYNDTNVLGKNSPIYEKRNQTVRDKYNCDNVFQTQEVKDKMKITMLRDYGVEFAGQTKNSRENCPFRRYYYKGIYFDSQPEFAFYLENENNGIKRNMDISFSYIYKNNNHITWPDFIIDNQFYEIKGSQFLDKETGKWILPKYRRNVLSEDEYKEACELMECRHQCLIQNNVKIIYDYEIKDLIKKWKDLMLNYKYSKKK